MGCFSLLFLHPISIQSISYSLLVLPPFSFPFILCFVLFSLMSLLFPPAPVFLKYYLFWGKKSSFQPFFSGLASFSIPSACLLFFSVLFDSSHFPSLQFKVLPFSRIPGFLCFLHHLFCCCFYPLATCSSASFQ